VATTRQHKAGARWDVVLSMNHEQALLHYRIVYSQSRRITDQQLLQQRLSQ